MAILNYTTKIAPEKTVSEIQAMLGRHGAHSVSTSFEFGEPKAIFFSLEIGKEVINFRLPCNWEGVFEAMRKDYKISGNLRNNDEQAKRVAWRIVKDWVEAQLAIIESGQAVMAEVFLPYAVTSSGQTCFQLFSNKPQLLLGM